MAVDSDRSRNDLVSNTSDLDSNEGRTENFYCGVVEGFYGCPWTTDQRKSLFERMQTFKMDTYLYAPKDDCKHRMYWRDLYSVEEADHLTGLIKEAAEHNINFVYALSPGLDMTYSNSKELTCLKRKLEQVASFGCKAFALLFDDIDVDMSDADKAIYQSFAQAQVSVTNEVYQHMNQPTRFLFCPTEYCSSRAVPTIDQSEYLNTIGSRLLTGIDIMWTGPKVISRKLTVEHIEEITKALHRPPVIWDNIHANDYDQKRLFLGPYDGRSTCLIPRLRGVMTNPNCEFEANFIAMHTLSQWAKSYCGDHSEAETLLSSSPIHSDIVLETQGDLDGSDEDLCLSSSYRQKDALHTAIKEWLPLFSQERSAPVTHMTGGVAPVITAPTHPIPTPNGVLIGPTGDKTCEMNESYMQPTTVAPVNSLVDASVDSGAQSGLTAVEPMDCAVTTSAHSASDVQETLPSGYDSGIADCSVSETENSLQEQFKIEVMQIDASPLTEIQSSCQKCSTSDLHLKSNIISCDDLHLIVDLFYMPFEHGARSAELLTELVWLKLNCSYLAESKANNATDEQTSRSIEWMERLDKFTVQLGHIDATFDKFLQMPNKAILKDLFSYIWDMKTILSLVKTFVRWLAFGTVQTMNLYYLQINPYTWSNTNYQEVFQNGTQEPWVFRGGLQAEFQRLLPLDGAGDLLFPCVPQSWTTPLFNIRPYTPADEAAVYEVCRKTCDDGLDGTDIFPTHPDLVGDRFVGSFLMMTNHCCFVVEDLNGHICGYSVATMDARDYSSKIEMAWIPAMQQKYAKPLALEGLSPAEEMICSFYSHKSFIPEDLCNRFPSIIRVDMLPECKQDPTAYKRVLAASMMALKTNGSHGVYAEMHVGDRNSIDNYALLNFYDIPLPDRPDDLVILGRAV